MEYGGFVMQKKGNSIFRKTSLDSISSPEQLNEYIKVLNPGVFVILAGTAAIIIAVVLWSIFGSVSDTVHVKGVIFPQDGIVDVIPTVNGCISDMRVKNGDFVNAGQIIAVIPQDDLINRIKEIKASSNIDTKEINSLIDEYEDESIIISPVSGIVTKAMYTGENAAKGKSIASIIKQEKYANDKQVICYVAASEAKKLSAGMEVQVSPGYAPREEYGYMHGIITSIGTYPVTTAEINSTIGDIQNKNDLLPQGSAVEVRINLTVDPNSKDLIKWSNKKGEKVQVSIGTDCDIAIVVKRQRPIELIFDGIGED